MTHLRVTIIPWLHRMSLDENGQVGGYHGGLFTDVCHLMNATHMARLPEDLTWGDCNETACSGMFAPVMANESDVAFGPHSYLNTYGQHFDPGSPVTYEQYVVITGMMVAFGTDSTSLLWILDIGMYVMMISLPWLVAISIFVVVWLQNKMTEPEEQDFGVLVVSGYQTILNQDADFSSKSVVSRAIVILFIFVAFFVNNLFSSFIKASMVMKPPTKRISYIRELVRETNLRPVITANSYLSNLIRIQGEANPDHRALAGIFDKFGLPASPQEVMSPSSTRGIFNGTSFTILDCELFKYFFYYGWQANEDTKKAFYYCAKDFVMVVHATWYFNRHTLPKEFVREFNRKTNWLLESPSRYVQEFKLPQIPPWSRVYDNPINEDNDDPITLQETAGSLFIYSVGIGFSCLFFCLECLFYYIEARRKGKAVSFRFSSVWRLLTANRPFSVRLSDSGPMRKSSTYRTEDRRHESVYKIRHAAFVDNLKIDLEISEPEGRLALQSVLTDIEKRSSRSNLQD